MSKLRLLCRALRIVTNQVNLHIIASGDVAGVYDTFISSKKTTATIVSQFLEMISF